MSRAAIHLGTLDFISGHNVRDERLSGSHVQPKTMSLDLSFLSISSIFLKKNEMFPNIMLLFVVGP